MFRECFQGSNHRSSQFECACRPFAGDLSEWSLVRRHPSEKVFGVQLAGNNAWSMARAAELIERHCDVDFVDINMGCPLDLVCNRGMGAGECQRHGMPPQHAALLLLAHYSPLFIGFLVQA